MSESQHPIFSGPLLAELRRARGVSQYELADALDTSQTTITFWETDRTAPRPQWVPEILQALSATPAELFGREPATLAEIRYARGVAQNQLLKVLRVTRRVITRIELGERHSVPSRDLVSRWAEQLELTEDEWLDAFFLDHPHLL